MRGKSLILIALSLMLLPLSTYAVTMIPMRDGTLLATDLFLPPDTADGPVPIVLERTCYGRGSEGALTNALLALGIGFASQDTRGRGGSEGVDSLFFDDAWGLKQDGYDAVEWLASQPWCNGRVGMFGASATGILVYNAVAATPPHLTCAFSIFAASNLYSHAAFPGGCFRAEQVDGFAMAVGLTYLRDAFSEHFLGDSFWDPMRLYPRRGEVTIPIMHISGWYDTFLQGNTEAFEALQYEGGPGALGNQKLIVGPWTHGNFDTRTQGGLTYPANSILDILPVFTDWFAHYLKDEANGIEATSPVKAYLLGDVADTVRSCHWEDFTHWPPSEAVADSFFLGGEGTLTTPMAAADTFRAWSHNPASPMRCSGGRNLFISAGPVNQTTQDHHPQGLIFTTAPLEHTYTMIGRVKVRLFVSSDCIDTDFIVRLEDVSPTGRSMLLFDGALQARFREGVDHEVFLEPDSIYEVEVDLGDIASAFLPDHSIRIGLSSALSNRYEANPNTGEVFRQNTHTLVANNKVYLGPSYPSRLLVQQIPGMGVATSDANSGSSIRLSVAPSPLTGTGTALLTLPRAADGRLVLTDLLGRTLRVLGDGPWSAGENRIPLEVSDLPSGVYQARFESGRDLVATERVLIVR